jgi:hypothetical protein
VGKEHLKLTWTNTQTRKGLLKVIFSLSVDFSPKLVTVKKSDSGSQEQDTLILGPYYPTLL